jgi:hypothetical protein
MGYGALEQDESLGYVSAWHDNGFGTNVVAPPAPLHADGGGEGADTTAVTGGTGMERSPPWNTETRRVSE